MYIFIVSYSLAIHPDFFLKGTILAAAQQKVSKFRSFRLSLSNKPRRPQARSTMGIQQRRESFSSLYSLDDDEPLFTPNPSTSKATSCFSFPQTSLHPIQTSSTTLFLEPASHTSSAHRYGWATGTANLPKKLQRYPSALQKSVMYGLALFNTMYRKLDEVMNLLLKIMNEPDNPETDEVFCEVLIEQFRHLGGESVAEKASSRSDSALLIAPSSHDFFEIPGLDLEKPLPEKPLPELRKRVRVTRINRRDVSTDSVENLIHLEMSISDGQPFQHHSLFPALGKSTRSSFCVGEVVPKKMSFFKRLSSAFASSFTSK
jgi:hypothetical protein